MSFANNMLAPDDYLTPQSYSVPESICQEAGGRRCQQRRYQAQVPVACEQSDCNEERCAWNRCIGLLEQNPGEKKCGTVRQWTEPLC